MHGRLGSRRTAARLYSSYHHQICMVGEPLHDFSHGDALAAAESGRGEAVVDDAADEFLDFVAEAEAVPLIEELLVLVLVLVAELEIVGLPPWGGNVGIAFGA